MENFFPQCGKTGGRPEPRHRRGCALGLAALLLLPGPALAQGSRHAVRFFGTGTGQIDRIKIPLAGAPALNVGDDFTIEFWLRCATADNAGTVAPGADGDGWITGNVILDRDVYGGGDYGDFGLALGREAGRSVLAFGAHNGTWGHTIVGTNHVGDGAWHHVALRRTRASGLMEIFVDGRPDAAGSGPGGDLSYRVGRATSWPASDPYLVLAAEKHDAGSAYPSFNGALDEVRIWSRILATDELARVRAEILDPELQTGLVACWRFEEGAGTLVRDCAGGATGTLFSGVAGNGEWLAWATDSNTAPLAAFAPVLAMPTADSTNLALRWHAPEHIRFEIQGANVLSTATVWSAVGTATNLRGTNSALRIDLAADATNRFYRVQGTPFE